MFLLLQEAPGSPNVTMDVGATSIKVSWRKPADDGGSPITAYRVLVLKGNTTIYRENITIFLPLKRDIGGLTKSTNYTVKVFARNYVFEGNATEKNIQTKFQGKRFFLNGSISSELATALISSIIIIIIIIIVCVSHTYRWPYSPKHKAISCSPWFLGCFLGS